MFSAIGHPARLDVFRYLIRADVTGVPAGQIAGALGLAPSTLSHHLSTLEQASLVTCRREGRNIIYSIDPEQVRALVAYLTDDCCGGRPELCRPELRAPDERTSA